MKGDKPSIHDGEDHTTSPELTCQDCAYDHSVASHSIASCDYCYARWSSTVDNLQRTYLSQRDTP